MQAPRNWRMNIERYRLLGSENQDGASIVKRPVSLAKQTQEEKDTQPELIADTAA